MARSKPVITTVRYAVTRAFDYLDAGEQFDFTTRSNSRDVDVRRTDGSGIGTFIPLWQFRRELAGGGLVPVEA